MICESVKPKLRSYFEDSLPEAEREPLRGHLKGCRACRDYSFAFSSFGTDLRRLAVLEPPEEIKEEILQAAQKPETPSESAPVQRSHSPWGWILAAAILSISVGFWYANQHSARKPAAQTAEETSVEPVPLPPIGETALSPDQKPMSSSKYAVTLRPFHWDVEFTNLEKRNQFLAGLRKHYGTVKAHFESPSFIVFSSPRSDLKDLLGLLMQLGAGVKGGGTIPSHIPEYSDTVRVSMSLGVPQSRISRSLSHHWHLKFELPNRFSFKESLRDAGARFLYEMPEIWVLEIDGKNFEKIGDIIRSTHGLTLDTPLQFISTDSYKIPVRITLYLDEE